MVDRTACRPPGSTLLSGIVGLTQLDLCLELGTSVGFSAAYLAPTMRKNGLGNVDVEVGKFANVLPGLLQDTDPIGFAYIDGHHQEQPTLDYWHMIRPHLSSLSFDRYSAGSGA